MEKIPLLNTWMKYVRCLFIDRDNPKEALKTIIAGIENIRKGFVKIAKHAKADIVPVSIVGFDGYAKKMFEKSVTVVIGEPISYQLDEDEIIQKWCAEICKNHLLR